MEKIDIIIMISIITYYIDILKAFISLQLKRIFAFCDILKDFTYWMPRQRFIRDNVLLHNFTNPGHQQIDPITLAIGSLFELAFNNFPSSVSDTIAGAEWWIQRKNQQDGINFHYDKDEGVASEQQ